MGLQISGGLWHNPQGQRSLLHGGCAMEISTQLDAIQRAVIFVHRELFEESPTPMKLQKLCYYVQGYSLAIDGTPLFEEDFQAWQFGPVIPSLYSKHKGYQWRQISEALEGDVEVSPRLRAIVGAYGKFDGAALSTMTHREAPWLDARQGIPETDGSSSVISKESMRGFFAEKIRSYSEEAQ